MEELTLEKFEEASEVVRQVTSETKLVYSEYFSAQTGNKVYFKPENMQYTGAYKVRGAYYKISTLSQEERSRGLITASGGGLCGPSGRGKGSGGDADYHTSDEGEPDEKLRRRGDPGGRCV